MASLELGAAWTSRGASRVLGAQACADTSGHVLLTTTDQVLLINTAKASQLHSWEFRADSAQALTLAAVKHPKKDRYYAVRGKAKNEVVAWSTDTERLHALTGVKLPRGSAAAAAVLVDAHLDGCLVVGASGAVYLIADDNTASPRALVDATDGATVVWAHLSSDATHQLSLVFIAKDDSNAYEVIGLTLSQEHDKAPLEVVASTRRALASPADGAVLTTAVPQAQGLALFWSTGDWQSLAPDADDAKHVTTLALTNDHDDSKPKDAKRRKVTATTTFRVAALSPKSIAVAAGKTLRVWSSQYGVLLATYALSHDIASLVDVLFHPKTNAVALVTDAAVHVSAISPPAATLASVLGKGLQQQSSMASPPLALSTFLPTNATEVTQVVGHLDMTSWEATMLAGNDEQLNVLRTLTSAALTPTKDAFTKVFYGYIYFKTKRKLRAVFSPQFVVQVAKRCVESDLGLWHELSLLVQTKHLCSRSIPALVPTAMAAKQFGVLQDCLLHLSDVDEAMTIRIVKFILRHATPASVAAFQAQAPAVAADVTTPARFVEHFLNLLVALPRADVFLQNAMQELKLAEVLAILVCLKKWYSHPASPESLNHIVEWIGLLLDVHYTTLVLESDGNAAIVPVLTDMQALLAKHLDACNHMADVHGELDQFLSGSNLPKTGALPDYSSSCNPVTLYYILYRTSDKKDTILAGLDFSDVEHLFCIRERSKDKLGRRCPCALGDAPWIDASSLATSLLPPNKACANGDRRPSLEESTPPLVAPLVYMTSIAYVHRATDVQFKISVAASADNRVITIIILLASVAAFLFALAFVARA
ncbi:Aste57867_10722 [Aphanomyces stellatus]|uniref:Aste57867_10722 protein n=1 Tax=Aphanomyces stellatus TaxID=120398 RepID=A0A485KS79_9STRA|nr:hypothetical protein As57867_010682 [Aphanomyces stellatus]VFT87592.1 Aste57867_10722 [Aphanomyces stellatus]